MKRTIAMLTVISGPATHVKVELYYSKGGMNYFTSRAEDRGVYMSATPVSIERSADGSYTTESFTAFSGIKRLVLPCSRFNRKTFDSLAPSQAEIDELVNHVVAKNSITLAEAG